MLGRLRMSVSDCEAAYLNLSNRIFNPKRADYNVPGRLQDAWKVEGRFDSEQLRLAIEETIESCQKDTDTLFKDPGSPCKV
jgi:hypothetical protein